MNPAKSLTLWPLGSSLQQAKDSASKQEVEYFALYT